MPKPSAGEYASAIFVGPWWGLDPWSARMWPIANELSRTDRMAVVRATQRGANVGEARLAPAVIDYSAVVREHRGLVRQLPWMITGFVLFTLVVHFIARASLVTALVAGLAWLAFMIVGIAVLGRRSTLHNAARAEQRARELLGTT